jgi:pimeloyl-ACP methyl ester carboxylesterase
MEKHFYQCGGVNIFYRKCGKGPFLVLLHPSPRNSRMMEPLMNVLSAQCTCIAPDIPGYGYSEPQPSRATGMNDYVKFLAPFFRDVVPEKFMLYGTATGAQLSIAYALQYPDNLIHLFLDNCAHFTDAECNDILQHYFPDFTPVADGSHLQKIWNFTCNSFLYFPWYDQQDASRIATALPAVEVLQTMAEDCIMAGPHYADAYKAAFLHERVEKLVKLTAPTTVFRWAGSPIKKQMDALLSYSLPANISIVHTAASMSDRYETMRQTIFRIIEHDN